MVTWVVESLHTSYQLGISQRRADWFVKWTRTTVEQKTVHMAKFVMYVTGALERERPFMAPLCKFMTIHPRHSVQAVPSHVAFFLAVPCRSSRAEASLCMRGADLSVLSGPESGRTGVGRADRNRRLAPVSPSGRLCRPVDVSEVQSGVDARKLTVGVREVRHTVASHLHVGAARSALQLDAFIL